MASFVAFAVTLLCVIPLQSIVCPPPPTLVIDTPEVYAQLKQGHFDGKYEWFDVTSNAHPQILLEPQHFADSEYRGVRFISIEEDGNNTIEIFPQLRWAWMNYYVGENPMSGVPKYYEEYRIKFRYPAKPTVENIDCIVQWTNALKMFIFDQEDVVVSLYKRIDEFSNLKNLRVLDLFMQDDTYQQFKVATFMDNLMNLNKITFSGNHMTVDQMKEFEFKNKIPWNWRGFLQTGYIYYKKKSNKMIH